MILRHSLAMGWRECIESDPQILRGKPGVKATCIPVALILGYLAAGKSASEILQEYPDLQLVDVAASLDYARDLADFEAVATA